MMYCHRARRVMAGKIFINYRRDDSMSAAGRLQDRLAQTFGRNNLFMDVDHIPAGIDFVDYLHSQVAACDVFLAVIGPNWLDARDDSGRRRFDNPDDYVTIEIAAALARNIRVIPVLVDGARTPKADKLPDSVKPLARRNAVEVRNTHFGRDAEALANKVREALQGARPVTGRWPFLASAAAWLMALGQWRTVAGTATVLLLVGWIGLYQVGVPVWVPWAPDPPRADKAKAAADAEARRKAEEAEQQRLKEEEQRQAQAVAGAEAKRKAAEAEQQRLKEEEQRQAKAAADAEAKRKAAEAEQQRLAAVKAEERKAEEAEQQRLAALKAEEERKAKSASTDSFEWRSNMMATGYPSSPAWDVGGSMGECERKCSVSAACKVFSYNKINGACSFYTSADFVPNDLFDSGIRAGARAAALPAGRPVPTVTNTLFTVRSNMMATGYPSSPAQYIGRFIGECEQKCAQSAACKVFAYNKINGTCNFYTSADFVPNDDFDSGIRN
jgi:TIR domain/PAN domain